ncbi:Hypothetical protein PHPALM_3195 [Phytophthora palmivora]|uniref:Uncharacterized protein n=1 Tax=Phytophthora palmivora TaxID=4796 RepID=A0A2P4YMZ4_9STRA|nr:Hypothetical protein PHPALM_3195 [Phytophthora palmivora]
MVAGRGPSKRRGHEGLKRADASRQSHRVQRLRPPEQESLEAVAANEEAHHVSKDGESDRQSKTVEGEFDLDEPDQGSVGSGDVKGPRTKSRVSDSSPSTLLIAVSVHLPLILLSSIVSIS